MNVLEIEGLEKRFAGRNVLDGVFMKVPEHSVYGFLGVNGAGKTTTMKLTAGLLKPEKGKIKIMGEEVRYGNSRTNRYVGYLPDVPEFYPYMDASEYMKLCAEVSGLEKKYARDRITRVLNMVELGNIKKRIGGYSRGMKQRLGIAQALLGEPELLICDEPTSALDPLGRREILDILKDAGRHTTVLFSTHILSDAERICDRAAILHRGRVALEGSMEELRASHGREGIYLELENQKQIRVLSEDKRISDLFRGAEVEGNSVCFYEKCSGNGSSAERRGFGETGPRLMRAMVEKGICPIRMEVMKPSLEKIFMEVVQ